MGCRVDRLWGDRPILARGIPNGDVMTGQSTARQDRVNITLSDTRVVLAAFEAVIGPFIEISFIATFTKRFFGG